MPLNARLASTNGFLDHRMLKVEPINEAIAMTRAGLPIYIILGPEEGQRSGHQVYFGYTLHSI